MTERYYHLPSRSIIVYQEAFHHGENARKDIDFKDIQRRIRRFEWHCDNLRVKRREFKSKAEHASYRMQDNNSRDIWAGLGAEAQGLNRDAEGMPSDGDADCCDKWGGLKQRTVEDMRRDHSND